MLRRAVCLLYRMSPASHPSKQRRSKYLSMPYFAQSYMFYIHSGCSARTHKHPLWQIVS